MPKTVQIRDLDDEVYAGLARRAAEERITVPELLRREAARLASRPSMTAWLSRIGRRPSSDRQERARTDLSSGSGRQCRRSVPADASAKPRLRR
jgi:hypothetical protein